MPVVHEDDFGVVRPAWKGRLRGTGTCLPQHQIGAGLWDVMPEPEITPRQHDLDKVSLDSRYYPKESISTRRLKGPVLDQKGEVKTSQNQTSDLDNRREGVKIIDFVPAHQKGVYAGSKRCFDWVLNKPSGFHNPIQWEDEVGPGKRPSHPVSANGMVALDRKKIFPEQPTGIPPKVLSKPPFGSEWGGWAQSGAPGRAPLMQPWDSLLPASGDNEVAENRFCDARLKRFPEMKYPDTTHLIQWHLDAQADIDPVMAKRVHLNQPTASSATSAAGQQIARVPRAGKPSNMPVEGAALPWYEKVREKELKAPLTAR
eukprot:TRINITY_DN37052_c0_g1_i1.p1 TRINITY_DN37052_c0_g1~~TRINITY_DN37052_c0_g1_i1.p1  ORF type:complete len:315 (-),score=54.12 TRINITY_DN37052_c0_g1_i1:74-1018(-)